MKRQDKEKILEALRHPNDPDYWANACEDIAKALAAGDVSTEDQQELVFAFWERMQLVVKISVEEERNAGVALTFEKAEGAMCDFAQHLEQGVRCSFGSVLARKLKGQGSGPFDKTAPYMYGAMAEFFAKELDDVEAAQEMLPDLLEGAAAGDPRARKSSLAALTWIGSRLGSVLDGSHSFVISALTQLVFDSKVARQARLCVAAFAPALSKQIFDDLAQQIMSQLTQRISQTPSPAKIASAETFLALVGPCGGRLRAFVPSFMQAFLADVNSGESVDWDEPEDFYDLLSVELSAVAGLVEKCPAEVGAETSALLQGLMATEWGYEWSNGLFGIGSMPLEDDDYSDDGVWSDDDDWGGSGGASGGATYEPNKSDYVRAGALKVVIALLKSRSDLLQVMLEEVAPTASGLIAHEQCEDVKQVFLKSLTTLARQVSRIEKGSAGELTASLRAVVNDLLPTICGFAAGTDRISSEKSTTVDSLFRLLTELGNTVGWSHFNTKTDILLPSMEYVLSNDGATSAAKVRLLVFIQQLAEHSSSLEATSELLPLLIQTVPQGYNVTKAALEACGSIAKFVQGPESQELYNAVNEMFMRDALDGDIKHAAITSMGAVLVACGVGAAALGAAQERLASQLNNEVTRTGAVIVIGMLATAGADISAVLGSSLQKVIDLTRQADGFIRHQALQCLGQIAGSPAVSASLSNQQVQSIMQGIADKIPGELKDVELALQAMSALVCSLGAGCANNSQELLMGSVCKCLSNDAFQGAAVDATLQYLAALAKSGCDPEEILKQLISASSHPAQMTRGGSGLTRVASGSGGQGIGGNMNMARAIGALCGAAGAAVGNKAVVELMKMGSTVFVLHAIGEIAVNGVGEVAGLQEMVSSSLKEGDEAQLFAAAFTVGCLCVGNSEKYIPYVVSQLGSGNVNKVVMLTAVKEAVTRCVDLGKTDLLLPHVQSSILPLLVSLASSNNDAARIKVQDCLGKLLKMAPADVMDTISSSSSGGDTLTRASAYGCLRYYSSGDDVTDALVLPWAIQTVSQGVSDSEANVRLSAVRATTSLLPKPKYFRASDESVLNALLGGLLAETRYVNVVKETMGSITLETDLGLENREAAFLCLCQALDHLEDKLPISAVVEAAAAGCGDKAGIIVRCAALKIVQTVASGSASMLSEHIVGLKDAVLGAIKDSRAIRKESEAEFTVIRNFIMSLRDTLGAFKDAEPSHSVFGELEAGLDKQRKDWAASKVPATRELVFLVDEFRGMKLEAGAEAEV